MRQVFFLIWRLIATTFVWWIPAYVCLPSLVLEIDLRLIQWRRKQIVTKQLHCRSCRRADAQPIQPQRVVAGDPVLLIQRQELLDRFLLAKIEHVALIFGDDECEPRDLSWKVTQFDPPETSRE